MQLKLEGKRALVTGSSSGIGEAIAKGLAQEGVKVVIHGRNKAELDRVAKEIGGNVKIVTGDLANDNDAERIAVEAEAAYGGIDILVNNAGAFPQLTWWTGTAQDWLDLYNTNVGSMVRMIQAFVPKMKERGWGRVIQLASIAGSTPMANMPHYSATKSANISLTVSLAKEVGGSGVTVNTVSPGPILTPGVETMFRQIAKENNWGDDWDVIEKKSVAQILPVALGRFGRPHEIASAVAFLASDQAAYIHGADIRVDGGFSSSVN